MHKTHEYTITYYGLRGLLPQNIEVRAGPGCPVCVTAASEIDVAINLSLRRNLILTTFGDMFKVPGSRSSLMEARGMGGDVRIVYSIHDAVELAFKEPSKEVVHFSIGFETTAPSTAAELLANAPKNFSIIPSHRLIPPAMEYLLGLGEIHIDGFICPGHVSTVIGAKPYRPLSEKYRKPQVIAGFEPIDVLMGIAMILRQIKEGRHEVEVQYTRSVREEGNVKAQEAMQQVFKAKDIGWRGIGVIPKSGLELKKEFEAYDALRRFDVKLKDLFKMPPGCRCGEVLRGLIYPAQCPQFLKACTPLHPLGPCAISVEGACQIAMKHGERGLS